MIIKSFEISKINFNKNNFYLLYGENEGYKNQIIAPSGFGKYINTWFQIVKNTLKSNYNCIHKMKWNSEKDMLDDTKWCQL